MRRAARPEALEEVEGFDGTGVDHDDRNIATQHSDAAMRADGGHVPAGATV